MQSLSFLVRNAQTGSAVELVVRGAPSPVWGRYLGGDETGLTIETPESLEFFPSEDVIRWKLLKSPADPPRTSPTTIEPVLRRGAPAEPPAAAPLPPEDALAPTAAPNPERVTEAQRAVVDAPPSGEVAAAPLDPAPDLLFSGFPTPHVPRPNFRGLSSASVPQRTRDVWENKLANAEKVREISRLASILREIDEFVSRSEDGDLALFAAHYAHVSGEPTKAMTFAGRAVKFGAQDAWRTRAALAIIATKWPAAVDSFVSGRKSGLSRDDLIDLGRCLSRMSVSDRDRPGLAAVVETALSAESLRPVGRALLTLLAPAGVSAVDEWRTSKPDATAFLAPASDRDRAVPAAVAAPTDAPQDETMPVVSRFARRPSAPTTRGESTLAWISGEPRSEPPVGPTKAPRGEPAPLLKRLESLPRDGRDYARAKRADQLGEFARAEDMFAREIAGSGPNHLSAVKDLALLLSRLDRAAEALAVLDRSAALFSKSDTSLDQVRVNVLDKARRYSDALVSVRGLIERSPAHSRTALRRREAYYLWRSGNRREAERLLRELTAHRFDPEATTLLERVLANPTGQAPEERAALPTAPGVLPNHVGQPNESGAPRQRAEPELQLVGLGESLSGLAKFALDRCELRGVDEQSKTRGYYDEMDFKRLDAQIIQMRRSRPRDRGELFLSLARLVQLSPATSGERSCGVSVAAAFLEFGTAALADNLSDTARSYLTEVLAVLHGKDFDLALALLVATFDRGIVQQAVRGRLVLSAVTPPVWEAFSRDLPYFVALCPGIHDALKRAMPSSRSNPVPPLSPEMTRVAAEAFRVECFQLRQFRSTPLVSLRLREAVASFTALAAKTRFGLDRERLHEAATCFAEAADYVGARDYLQRENRCLRLAERIEELQVSIARAPTKLTVEEVYPILERLLEQCRDDFGVYAERAKPQITVENVLASDDCAPDRSGWVTIALRVASAPGGGPADAVEVMPQAETHLTVDGAGKLGLLQGGEVREVAVRLRPSSKLLDEGVFSLRLSLRYRDRVGATVKLPETMVPLRFGGAVEFQRIDNPFASYSGGTEVSDPKAFFGRKELLSRIEEQVARGPVGQCFVLYGQKRSGKTSVAAQLQRRLQKPCLVAKTSIGHLDVGCPEVSFARICVEALEDAAQEATVWPLPEWPSLDEIRGEPGASLRGALRCLRRGMSAAGWVEPRIILIIDEFTNLFGHLRGGRIQATILQQWKALLESKAFSAVLIGQDSMPRFKAAFPNEFGRTADERLSYLDRSEMEGLATQPILLNGGSRFRGGALDHLWWLTRGSPFMTQIVCDWLVRHLNDQRASLITSADVEAVERKLVSGGESLSFEKFDQLVTADTESVAAAPRSDYEALLARIALASSRTTGAAPARVGEDDATRVLLLDLRDRHIVDFDASGDVSIRVGLFAEWLRHNFAGATT